MSYNRDEIPDSNVLGMNHCFVGKNKKIKKPNYNTTGIRRGTYVNIFSLIFRKTRPLLFKSGSDLVYFYDSEN